MILRICFCGVLTFLSTFGIGDLCLAQGIEPNPAPHFRWYLPTPPVEGKGVKKVVVADYEMWKEDSAAIQGGKTLRLRKEITDQAELYFDRAGKLQRGLRVYEEGGELDADWEDLCTYDEKGRLTYVDGHYLAHEDGETFEPESESYAYDEKGRVIEELLRYQMAITGRDTVPNVIRYRYTYSPDGRSGTRETCYFKGKKADLEKCKVDSTFFDENGRLLEIRWMNERYRRGDGTYPPALTCSYDKEGKLIRLLRFAYGVEDVDFHYAYDTEGRLVSVKREEKRNKHKGYYVEHREYQTDGLLRRVWREGEGMDFAELDFVLLYELY